MTALGFTTVGVLLAILVQNAPVHAISGAHVSLPGHFQHQALLHSGDKKPICSGALIAPKWVLTAASCVKGVTGLKVTVGAFDLTLEEESQQHFTVVSTIVHEDFDKETYKNDIALLQLNEEVVEDEFVGLAVVPTEVKGILLWEGSVSGYGFTASGDTTGNWVLRWFDSRVMPGWWCQLRAGSSIYKDESHICLASLWKKGMCNGDGGSPLTFFEADGSAAVAGIASNNVAASCDNHQTPLFTRVSHFADWIAKTAGI